MLLAAHDPYATGVLRKDVHERLVVDLENVARDAMIQEHWVWTPLADAVNPKIVNWVRGYNGHAPETTGLCLIGKTEAVEDQMSAIAGALLRNFIRARVFTVNQILDRLEAKTFVQPTCLLIPNFFLGKASGTTLVNWKVQALMDMLLERHQNNYQTVLHVSDLKELRVEYGAFIEQFIQTHYVMLSAH